MKSKWACKGCGYEIVVKDLYEPVGVKCPVCGHNRYAVAETFQKTEYFFRGVAFGGTNNFRIKPQYVTESQIIEMQAVIDRYDTYVPRKSNEKVEIQPEDTM